MKVWYRSLADPSLQLTALAVLVLLAYASRGAMPRASSTSPAGHPVRCHACSTVPPGAASATEACLVRAGCIDDPGRDD